MAGDYLADPGGVHNENRPVKSCFGCGRMNGDEAKFCRYCDTEYLPRLKRGTPLPVNVPPFIDPLTALARFNMGFAMVEGFARPDWNFIADYVRKNIAPKDLGPAWDFVAKRWLTQLAHDLGGEAKVYQSDNILCVSDRKAATVRTLLTYAESALKTIRSALKEAAWRGFNGKHVLLIFPDEEKYFSYISYYYPDGTHAMTRGVFIRAGYVHIAIPVDDMLSTKNTLMHELVHNLLFHLPIPLWLNEGLAVFIEKRMNRLAQPLNQEMADKHHGYWNHQTIQEFWTGQSFHQLGEGCPLSYSLGRILVTLMTEKGQDFITFITKANRRDAGQSAALEILKCNLGDVAGQFLGPGDWSPKQEIIDGYFKKKV